MHISTMESCAAEFIPANPIAMHAHCTTYTGKSIKEKLVNLSQATSTVRLNHVSFLVDPCVCSDRLIPRASAESRSMYGKYKVKVVNDVIVQYVFTQ